MSHAGRYRVIKGDCLQVMRGLRTGCVDFVMTSPPYEDARTYGIGFKHRGEAWAQWCADRYMECLRISSGLVVWVVGHGKGGCRRWSAAPALLIAELHKRGACLRNPPIFSRVGIPGSGQNDWLRADYEWIVCATRESKRLPWSDNTAMGHTPKWGPGGEMSHRLSDGTRRNQWGHSGTGEKAERKRDGTRGTAKRPSHWRCTAGTNPDGTQKPNRSVPIPAKANPGNIVHGIVGGGQMGSKLAHENEAPYPEWLVEFFVRSFCPPDGIGFDPFCGSGTTLAVLLKNGRRAAGVDCRASQVKLTERRIREALAR